MRRFFRFVVFGLAIIGGVYLVRKFLEGQNQPAPASGVIPSQPIRSLDEAPLGGQISPELLKILVDPEDKGPLELVDDGKFLLNPRSGNKYPIRNGIPVMLIEEGKKYRDTAVAVKANGSTI
jgi:hypothetical protein